MADLPMGVSEWRNHGEKHGYFSYFKRQYILEGRKEVVDSIKESMTSGELRDSFEEYFPKDIEAEMGIRQSKSNRAGALGLWGQISIFLHEIVKSNTVVVRCDECNSPFLPHHSKLERKGKKYHMGCARKNGELEKYLTIADN